MNRLSLTDPDTICAIATPQGVGSLGIIRLSGEQAIEIASKIVRLKGYPALKDAPSRAVLFGEVVPPFSTKPIDEILCTIMRAPRSYTGEDVVELSGHGNPQLLQTVLDLLASNGARLAARGEFTKRAFLNGKMDLSQAEGVMDTVSAKTKESMGVAIDQLQGKLGKWAKKIRLELLNILAPIEAGIDFPEEEVPEVPRHSLKLQMIKIAEEIEKALFNATEGKILREGLTAVIVGKPNVGKSSLLNALLQEGRAIVTDIPGTTRDTIEEWTEVKGFPLRLIDTAGIRETENVVEQLGIARSKEALMVGDLVLVMLDRSKPLEEQDQELLDFSRGKEKILVLNKMDLEGPVQVEDLRRLDLGPVVPVSVKENYGIEELKDKILQRAIPQNREGRETPLITRARHQQCLERCWQFVHESLITLEQELPFDLIALDLRGGADAIGEITGEIYTDDLLEKIFSQFCVGK